MDLIIIVLLSFLAGVGLGTFILGTFLRRIIAETKAEVITVAHKAEQLAVEAENALKNARKALP